MPKKYPVYLQLADLIERKINKNVYPLGSKIPSERELIDTFGISRMTVRKAIEVLIEKGLLTRQHGKGTYVSQAAVHSPLDSIQSMGKFIQDSGLLPSNKVLLSKKGKAGVKYSKIFDIDPEDDIFLLFRLRLADGKPFALEYTYTPYHIIPDLDSYNFEQCSFYDLLETHNIKPSQDTQRLEIVRVMNPQAALLNVEEGSAVFMLHNTVTNSSGKTIEYTRSYYSERTITFTSTLT